jgi:hypothetical protein
MTRRHLAAGAVVVFLLTTGACSSKKDKPEPVVADVGARIVTIAGVAALRVAPASGEADPGDPPPDGVVVPEGVSVTATGEDTMTLSVPNDGHFTLAAWAGPGQVDVAAELRVANTTTRLVRYEALTIEEGQSLVLDLPTSSVGALRIGAAPSAAPPSVDLRGEKAADRAFPALAVQVADGAVTVRATSKGASGVGPAWVSRDGTEFEELRTPIALSSLRDGVLYAFAETGAGVRSSIARFTCSPSGCTRVED